MRLSVSQCLSFRELIGERRGRKQFACRSHCEYFLPLDQTGRMRSLGTMLLLSEERFPNCFAGICE